MPFCSNCGRTHVEGQRFCEQCGVLLPGAAPGPAPPAYASSARWTRRTADAQGRPYSAGRLAGQWEFASFGQRFGAAWVDGVVVLTVGAVLDRAETALLDQTFISPFFALLYSWAGNSYGKTVGKAVLGIEVVNHAWGRPGLGRGLIREFVSFISAFVVGLGYLSVLWDEESRAWHDHAADTWVIKRTNYVETAGSATTHIDGPLPPPAGVDRFRVP